MAAGNKKEAKFDSVDRYQVRGCVSTELGAHALVKITTRTGTELGSSVVCVTHLLHRDPTLIRSSVMKEVSALVRCVGRRLSHDRCFAVCVCACVDSLVVGRTEARTHLGEVLPEVHSVGAVGIGGVVVGDVRRVAVAIAVALDVVVVVVVADAHVVGRLRRNGGSGPREEAVRRHRH